MNNTFGLENEIYDIYHDISTMNSKNMYIHEIYNYPLLSDEEEKRYGKILMNKENKKLLAFNEVDGYSIPTLNVNLLFCSLCNTSSYKDVIEDLIRFYNGLNCSTDKAIGFLNQYKIESNKLNHALNYDELQNIFKITDVEVINVLNEKDLLKEIKEFMDYKLAFQKMFESNLRLVIKVAAKNKCNIDDIDLIQEGNLGLIKAIVGFDVSLGNKFSTYATRCIDQKIKRYISNNNSSIRLPEYLGMDLNRFKSKVHKLTQEEKRELSPSEIAERLGLSEKTVVEYLMYMDPGISLDESMADGEDLTLMGTISSDVDIEEIVMAKELKKDIFDFLVVLDERYKDIVKMKFGLGEYNGKVYSSREIGEKYSVSTQRINEIFYKSIYLMKRASKQEGKQKSLRDYFYK